MKEKKECDIQIKKEDIDRKLIPIDEMDLEILCHLRENSRMTNAQIAKELGVSEATVRRRIKELEKKGIIRGFSVLINYPWMENSIKAMIQIKVRGSDVDAVAETLKKNPRVRALYRVLGEFDIICEAIFLSIKEMQEFMEKEMRTKGIEYSVTYVVAKTYKSSPWGE
jgi:DNA-binding Lrp family transcriptional regulator